MMGCNEKRGSLVCEECDNWVIIRKLPKSLRYPNGFAIEVCKLDELPLEEEEAVI